MISKRRWLLVLLVGLAIALVAGCASSNDGGTDDASDAANGGAEETPAGDTDNEEVAEGESESADDALAETIYASRCITCHGQNLEGRVGDDSNLQGVGSRQSRDEIAATIRNGGDLMPAFEGDLTDEEIDALADWLAQNK